MCLEVGGEEQCLWMVSNAVVTSWKRARDVTGGEFCYKTNPGLFLMLLYGSSNLIVLKVWFSAFSLFYGILKIQIIIMKSRGGK